MLNWKGRGNLSNKDAIKCLAALLLMTFWAMALFSLLKIVKGG